MKFQILFIGCFLTIFPLSSNAQNLIHDGSFEVKNQCPVSPIGKATGYKTMDYLKYWYAINEWEADYFNTCQRPPTKEDNDVNMIEFYEPYEGDGYIGIRATTFGSRYREDNTATYAMTKLKEPLQEGRNYEVEFYATLYKGSTVAVANLGIYLSHDSIPDQRGLSEKLRIEGEPVEPQFEHKTIINNSREWTKVKGSFTAKGGEEFLVIGNFRDNEDLQWAYTDPEKKGWTTRYDGYSYYLVDKLSLYPVSNTAGTDWKNVELSNTLFDLNSFTISADAHVRLNEVVAYHQGHPNTKLMISGHCDDTGDEVHNQQLSLERARMVKKYLVKKGIADDRITLESFGSKVPKYDNSTEEGRRLNRRVEIMVIVQ